MKTKDEIEILMSSMEMSSSDCDDFPINFPEKISEKRELSALIPY